MSEFNIKTGAALNAADEVINCAVLLNDCINEISSVKCSIGSSLGSSSGNITSRLSTLCSELYNQDVNLTNLGVTLQNIVEEYKKNEFYVAASAEGKKQVDFFTYASQNSSYILPWALPAFIVSPFAPGLSLGLNAFSALQIFRKWWNDDSVFHGDLEANGWSTKDDSFKVKTDLLKFKDKDGKYIIPGMENIKNFNDSHNKWKDKGGNYTYDPASKSWKKAVTEEEKEAFKDASEDKKLFEGVDVTIASVGVEKKGYIGGIDASAMAGDKDGTHASAEAGLFYGKAEANAYIGYGSIGASAGASFAVGHAEAEAQWGSDMAGLYAKADVDVLKAEVGADANVGLFDKDGNFNPALHVGGKAQAVVAEASAKVGGKILGTDVGVKGSVNFGIGAHADFGLRDGKLTADLGASLGLGFGVKVELDFSGTVDAVCDFAEAAWDGACDIAEDVGDFVSDAWSGLGSLTGWW